ncbi:ABC-ATPase domain-containing protein [Streptomyces albus]|uniref:ABC-ATPase domain-containing protein n=1 Tax=Streptomyces albus TaxID=1888 RepID=UPI0030B8A7A0
MCSHDGPPRPGHEEHSGRGPRTGLADQLRSLEGAQYGRYKSLVGRWELPGGGTLELVRAQSDPYAPPGSSHRPRDRSWSASPVRGPRPECSSCPGRGGPSWEHTGRPPPRHRPPASPNSSRTPLPPFRPCPTVSDRVCVRARRLVPPGRSGGVRTPVVPTLRPPDGHPETPTRARSPPRAPWSGCP